MTPYAIRMIQQEADATLTKLGNGQFGSKGDQGAMELVQYRRGLLRALEILHSPAKQTDTEEL